MRWRTSRSGASSSPVSALSLLLLLLFAVMASAQKSASSANSSPSPSPTKGNTSPAATDTKSPTGDTKSPTQDFSNSPTLPAGVGSTSTQKGASSKTPSTSNSVITGTKVSLPGGISVSSKSGSAGMAPNSIFHLTALPSIAGATVPTMVVPDTAAAPFMKKSNLPEGTVFIIVGAILGFFGLSVLAWRGLVALSISRSVKRAALAQHRTFDLKSSVYPAPSGGMYSSPGSTASMERLSTVFPKTTKPRKSMHQHNSSMTNLSGPAFPSTARSSTQSLFFSPTAGAGHPSSTPSPLGNRNSTYLPAGYYASGSSQPAGGAGSTHINAHAAGMRGSSILNPLSDRLSGIRAGSAGYQRAESLGPSPPGSPMLVPAGPGSRHVSNSSPSSVVGNVGAGLYNQPSQSSLNLNVPGGVAGGSGRAPSAYLEDLFEHHGAGPTPRY